MENLKVVLEAAGTGFDKVVKATVFLADIGDFAAFNAVYADYFPRRPACAQRFSGGRHCRWGPGVEIEMVALAPSRVQT